MRLGIDLTGGDLPPESILEVALECLAAADIVAFVRDDFKKSVPGVECVFAKEAIEMDEAPLLAVRRKKHSVFALGMQHLKEKKIDAFLSAGNTGALVATACLHLKRLGPPALCVLLPKETGTVAVLDVGANISFKPTHLVDYASMAIVYKKLLGTHTPRVALLNIGIEEQKGTKQMQEGYGLLSTFFARSKEGQFLGNVEAREVFQQDIDVLLTDGFTGNIFLKTCEGVSSFLMQYLKKKEGTKEVLSHLHEKFSYASHPGAILLGVEGLVIKCHGYSDKMAWKSCIRGAQTLVGANLMSHLKEKLT